MKGGFYKTGGADSDELWVTDSTLNEGTNSLINKQIRAGRMVRRALSMLHNEHHKTHNGWYLGMVMSIYSIVGILILYVTGPAKINHVSINLCCYFKQIISYEKPRLKFYAIRQLIFAGPVTYGKNVLGQ